MIHTSNQDYINSNAEQTTPQVYSYGSISHSPSSNLNDSSSFKQLNFIIMSRLGDSLTKFIRENKTNLSFSSVMYLAIKLLEIL